MRLAAAVADILRPLNQYNSGAAPSQPAIVRRRRPRINYCTASIFPTRRVAGVERSEPPATQPFVSS